MTERDDLMDDGKPADYIDPDAMPVVRQAAEQAEQADRERQQAFMRDTQRRAGQVRTNVRLSVLPTGHAVRVTDAPNPETHSGLTFGHDQARILAHALRDGRRGTVKALEARILTVQPLIGGVAVYTQTQRPEQGWMLATPDAERIGQAILAITGEGE